MKKYIFVLLCTVILFVIYIFFSGSGSGNGHSGDMAYNSSGQVIGRLQ